MHGKRVLHRILEGVMWFNGNGHLDKGVIGRSE
jgi:hypothetical protein